MAEKVSDVPDTTEEIVGLQEYLKTVSSVEKKKLNPDYGCTVMLIQCIISIWTDWGCVFCSPLMSQSTS